MNKKILITIVVVATAWLFGQPFVFGIIEYDSVFRSLFQASGYIALGTIIFVAVYLIFKKPVIDGHGVELSATPILPVRILSLIILLVLLIYPAFFVDKGYFSNSLISAIDLLEIEQLNLNSEITSNEESVIEISSNLKDLKKQESFDKDLLIEFEENLKENQKKLKSNQRKRELNDQRFSNLKNRLSSLQEAKHFENLYYVMRALCLGALGAILTLLAASSIKSKKVPEYKSLFNEENYWQSLITNCLAGSIVSIVAFALLYTKQISIFTASLETKTQSPDFWRSTLLCLVAGAFAEKIYEAVSSKVDDYVTPSVNGPNNANAADAKKPRG